MTTALIMNESRYIRVQCGAALSDGAFIRSTAIALKYSIQLRTEM